MAIAEHQLCLNVAQDGSNHESQQDCTSYLTVGSLDPPKRRGFLRGFPSWYCLPPHRRIPPPFAAAIAVTRRFSRFWVSVFWTDRELSSLVSPIPTSIFLLPLLTFSELGCLVEVSFSLLTPLNERINFCALRVRCAYFMPVSSRFSYFTIACCVCKKGLMQRWSDCVPLSTPPAMLRSAEMQLGNASDNAWHPAALLGLREAP